MKILQVGSIYDYAALEFERNFDEDNYLNLWNKAKENEFDRLMIKKTLDKDTMNEHPQEFIIEAHEFGEVDKDFIKFIRDEFQDYDNQKHDNFYVIEED